MKVLIIKACAESVYKEYKKFLAAPPQSIFSLAASTPKEVDVELVDETIDMKVPFNTHADLVVVFFSTPDALRGYEIADKFRVMNKTVVLAGLHVKFNQKEALQHADAIMIGETEGIWESLLTDYKNGMLSTIYQRKTEVDLATLNKFPIDLIPLEKYGYVWSVLVSRGCVNNCGYCTVNRFFDTMRYRPIDDIINEIATSGAKLVELHSDNLTADRDYVLELFRRLIPLKIKWFAETTVDFADDDELVELAAKSGLSYLLLGLETPSRSALRDMDKGFMELERIKGQIKKLHKFKIIVDSAMLFGFDGHTEEIFKETIQYVKDIDLDITHGVVPIPFPGTKFYEQLEAEGRILTKDWSLYDGRHMVFSHAHLTTNMMAKGIKKFENEAYTLKGLLRYQKFLLKMGLAAMG